MIHHYENESNAYQLIQLFTDERWHLVAHFRHNHRVALQFVHDGCWHVGIDLSFVGDESAETVVIRYCMGVDECCNKKMKIMLNMVYHPLIITIICVNNYKKQAIQTNKSAQI